MVFKQRENISFYLKYVAAPAFPTRHRTVRLTKSSSLCCRACRAFGQKEFELFGTPDLFEGTGMKQVVLQIHSLGRTVQDKLPDFEPKLGIKCVLLLRRRHAFRLLTQQSVQGDEGREAGVDGGTAGRRGRRDSDAQPRLLRSRARRVCGSVGRHGRQDHSRREEGGMRPEMRPRCSTFLCITSTPRVVNNSDPAGRSHARPMPSTSADASQNARV